MCLAGTFYLFLIFSLICPVSEVCLVLALCSAFPMWSLSCTCCVRKCYITTSGSDNDLTN